ncbi:MAG: efflux RND transporter periplasmic adaptor subunit [Saprospiraceae bacterium]
MKYIFLPYLSVLLLFSCKEKKATPMPVEENSRDQNAVVLSTSQSKNASIQMGSIEKKNMSSTMKVNGIIDAPPQNMISISAPMGGYLLSTDLLPGTHINKGSVLAVLEDQQYIQLQHDFLIAKTRLNLAEKEYLRQKELNQSQASSDKVFQIAENEYQLLKITLSALREKLKIININPAKLDETTISSKVYIYSPIKGYVSDVKVNIGKYVNPTEVLFELIDPSDIHLNLKIFEKDIDKLKIGQHLSAYSNHNPTLKHPCKIILIGKIIGSDHTVDVHCHFEDYDKNLLPGMYMNATIELLNHDTWTLPETSIVTYEGNNFVFVEEMDHQYLMHPVTLGDMENEMVEIINHEDLLNKKIVTRGAYTLLMAMKNDEEL